MPGISIGQLSPGGAAPANAAAQGYGSAIGSLQKSLQATSKNNQAAMLQAQQQLAQNQGRVQQNAINSGLGNTSVAQSLQQAPLQTYNQAVANIQNNQNQATAKGYEALGSEQGEGALQLGNLMAALQAQQLQGQGLNRPRPTPIYGGAAGGTAANPGMAQG